MAYSKERLRELEEEVGKIVRMESHVLAKMWQKNNAVIHKNERDIATQIDSQLEENLRNQLSKLLPEAGFVVEEGVTDKKNIYNWLIDPIDGTKEFAYQTPMFVTHVALIEQEIPVVAVIYNPLTNQLFSASKGNGARVNSVQTNLHYIRTISESVVCLDLLKYSKDEPWKYEIFKALTSACYRVRVMPGIFSVYQIFGAYDAFIVHFSPHKIMDNLPRFLILEEAGCLVEEVNTQAKKVHIVAHPKLAKELVVLCSQV